MLRHLLVVNLTREDCRDSRGDAAVGQGLRTGEDIDRVLVERTGQHACRHLGDITRRHETDLVVSRRREDRGLVADSVGRLQQVLHVQARRKIRDRQGRPVQVLSDLPVIAHEAHFAARIQEPVCREFHDMWLMTGGDERVDESQLKLYLPLVRRAEQEYLVEGLQDIGRRRSVERRDHRLLRPRQVRSLRLHPYHRRGVGSRVGQRFHQVIADLAGGAGHENHGH